MPLTSSVVTQRDQISGSFVARKNSDAAKNVEVSIGTASILHFCENSVWGKVHFKVQLTTYSRLVGKVVNLQRDTAAKKSYSLFNK